MSMDDLYDSWIGDEENALVDYESYTTEQETCLTYIAVSVVSFASTLIDIAMRWTL